MLKPEELNTLMLPNQELTFEVFCKNYQDQIYFDPVLKKYYYPMSRGFQDWNGKVVNNKLPTLWLDPESNIQMNPLTGDEFIILDNLQDLELLSNMNLKGSLKIYVDSNNDFFYPVSRDIVDRKPVQVGTTPLIFYNKLKKWYDPDSGREYRKTKSLDELEKLVHIKEAERNLLGAESVEVNQPVSIFKLMQKVLECHRGLKLRLSIVISTPNLTFFPFYRCLLI